MKINEDVIVTTCPFCNSYNKTLCFDKDKREFNCFSCNSQGNEKALLLASQMLSHIKYVNPHKEELQ